MAASSDVTDAEATTFVQRVARLSARVANRYVDNAKAEAKGDVLRIAIGIMFMGLSGVLAVHTVVFAHVAFIVAVHALGAPLWAVVGVVVLSDACLMMACALIARILLWQPLLPRTRRQIAEAWHFLVG